MALLVALLALGTVLWGAASFLGATSLAAVAAVIAAWLLVFAVRERVARRRRRQIPTEG